MQALRVLVMPIKNSTRTYWDGSTGRQGVIVYISHVPFYCGGFLINGLTLPYQLPVEDSRVRTMYADRVGDATSHVHILPEIEKAKDSENAVLKWLIDNQFDKGHLFYFDRERGKFDEWWKGTGLTYAGTTLTKEEGPYIYNHSSGNKARQVTYYVDKDQEVPEYACDNPT